MRGAALRAAEVLGWPVRFRKSRNHVADWQHLRRGFLPSGRGVAGGSSKNSGSMLQVLSQLVTRVTDNNGTGHCYRIFDVSGSAFYGLAPHFAGE